MLVRRTSVCRWRKLGSFIYHLRPTWQQQQMTSRSVHICLRIIYSSFIAPSTSTGEQKGAQCEWHKRNNDGGKVTWLLFEILTQVNKAHFSRKDLKDMRTIFTLNPLINSSHCFSYKWCGKKRLHVSLSCLPFASNSNSRAKRQRRVLTFVFALSNGKLEVKTIKESSAVLTDVVA